MVKVFPRAWKTWYAAIPQNCHEKQAQYALFSARAGPGSGSVTIAEAARTQSIQCIRICAPATGDDGARIMLHHNALSFEYFEIFSSTLLDRPAVAWNAIMHVAIR